MNDILQKTYDVLDAKGWCQGALQLPDGRVCLEGAFLYAAGRANGQGAFLGDRTENPDAQAAWLLLVDTVKAETGANVPFEWNDRPSTTVEDVKLVLKKAIHAT